MILTLFLKVIKVLDESRVVEGMGIGIRLLGLNTIFTSYKLCDSGQVTQVLCALISTKDGR